MSNQQIDNAIHALEREALADNWLLHKIRTEKICNIVLERVARRDMQRQNLIDYMDSIQG